MTPILNIHFNLQSYFIDLVIFMNSFIDFVLYSQCIRSHLHLNQLFLYRESLNLVSWPHLNLYNVLLQSSTLVLRSTASRCQQLHTGVVAAAAMSKFDKVKTFFALTHTFLIGEPQAPKGPWRGSRGSMVAIKMKHCNIRLVLWPIKTIRLS